MQIQRMLAIWSLLLLICLTSNCVITPIKEDYNELLKAWTPEVRDAFIGMGKASGCFDLLIVNKQSCFSAVFIYNKNVQKWEIYCERLSQKEAPDCYLLNGDPIPINK